VNSPTSSPCVESQLDGRVMHERCRNADTKSRGYTVVELMMAMVVMTIGLAGIVAMQKVTVASNMNAKNLVIATHIGQSFLDELAAEAHTWTASDGFSRTVWLQEIGAEGTEPTWFAPAYDANRKMGEAFDALGTVVAPANVEANAHFCVHLRLSWLARVTNSGKTGAGLVRAETRVYWKREGAGSLGTGFIGPCVEVDDFADADPASFHTVYLSTALRQVPGGV
jgi:prepilin-type N-terminal cleavage/methylation domain-containing protein